MDDIGLLNRIKAMYTGQPYDKSVDLIPISEWEDLTNNYSDTHLRQSALDTVVGKIKNTSSQVIFESGDDNLNYLLNTKPNENENKSDFRNKLIDKMIYEGECLVIIHDHRFYIADSFTVDDKVFGDKTYKNVVVENLPLRKYFLAKDVFHFKYINPKLKRFMNSLDDSYGKLFKRLIEVHMRNNQIRIYAKFAQSTKDADNMDKYKKFLRGAEEKIKNDSVALIPTQQDYELNENAQSYESRSITEVGDLENMYVRQVANILQVPPLLFSGDLADISEHKDSYIKDCIRPLMTIIADEVNAKYFKKDEKDKLVKINVIWTLFNSEIEMGNAVEKMIGSGVWNIDMVLQALGKKPENTIVTTQRYLTKNMGPIKDDGTVEQ